MTKEQLVKIATALAEAIRELKSVPSGHLYARVMGLLTLEQYNGILDVLKDAGYVSESNHLLTWIGK